jgi:hypothetical protein
VPGGPEPTLGTSSPHLNSKAGSWLTTLDQAFGKRIAEMLFVLVVQAPNVLTFGSGVHHPNIQSTLKC